MSAWVWVSAAKARATSAATLEARLRAAHGIVGNGAEYVRTWSTRSSGTGSRTRS